MLLSLENISFGFGAQTIVEDINWQIFPGQKIGLIGLNGAGKSTILRIINGDITPNSGQIVKPKDSTIGFLNQDSLSFDSDDPILKVAMAANQEAMKAEEKMNLLAQQLENESNPKLEEQYNQALSDFELHGGFSNQHESEKILEGLGFKTHELKKPYSQFSGGWRMRVLLAKLILQQPDLLLLDEPTNHLDLPAIEWLEKYIQSYPGALVIISHDKTFLNRMCSELVELDRHHLIHYKGDYDFFLSEKKLKEEQLQKEFANQQSFIKQQERFIERFKAKASKATQAKSIQKKLDKIDRIKEPISSENAMKLKFKLDRPSGKIVLDIKDLSKSYPNITLFDHAAAMVERGDKIGLIGANGVGKTTLLHVIADMVDYSGQVKLGHHVDHVLYSQHQVDSLHLAHEMLQELQNHNTNITENEARNILGCFLFSGDDVYKKIKVLSGGEKSRVALAKILTSKSNFLLLDEPTNHLDMISKDMLVEALKSYEGTYLMVSHDRDFLAKTTNKIWEIAEGKIIEYPGSYHEWYRDKNEKAQKTEQTKEPIPDDKNKGSKSNNKQNREKQKELKKLYNKSTKLEKLINQKKEEQEIMLNELGKPEIYANPDLFASTETKYNLSKEELQKLETEYDDILSEIIIRED